MTMLKEGMVFEIVVIGGFFDSGGRIEEFEDKIS